MEFTYSPYDPCLHEFPPGAVILIQSKHKERITEDTECVYVRVTEGLVR